MRREKTSSGDDVLERPILGSAVTDRLPEQYASTTAAKRVVHGLASDETSYGRYSGEFSW